MKRTSSIFMLLAFVLPTRNVCYPQWVQTNLSPYFVVYSLAVSDSNLFTGTNGAIFLSADDGATWNKVSSDLTASIGASQCVERISLQGLRRECLDPLTMVQVG